MSTARQLGRTLGAVMKIEVTELVDPECNVVTKAPKSSLAMLIKTPQ